MLDFCQKPFFVSIFNLIYQKIMKPKIMKSTDWIASTLNCKCFPLALLLLFLFFTFLSIKSTAADNDVFKFPVNEKESSKIQSKIPHTPFMRVDFVQKKKIKGLNKEFISSGKLIFVAEKGMFWQVQKPFEDTFVFTKTGLIQFDDSKKKKQLPSSKHPFFKQLTKAFTAAFAGNPKELQKLFTVFYTSKESNAWVLGLKPKNANNSSPMNDFMTEMILSGDQYLKRISLKEANGDSTQIDFTHVDLKPLTKEEEAYFVF